MRRALAAPASATAELATVPLLMVALLGLLAIRLVALYFNATDLFFDEAQYWTWSREPAFGYYSKPPLVAALIGAASAVCGDGTFCVRVASPLLHTVTAGLVFLIGRRLYDERVGFWAALAFATLPGVIRHHLDGCAAAHRVGARPLGAGRPRAGSARLVPGIGTRPGDRPWAQRQICNGLLPGLTCRVADRDAFGAPAAA